MSRLRRAKYKAALAPMSGPIHESTALLSRPKSRFRIASISKPITAVAILQLIERGKLKLDDRVFDVLDLERFKIAASFDARWRDVTIQQLMHHTAGFDRAKSFDPMFISERICSAFRIE